MPIYEYKPDFLDYTNFKTLQEIISGPEFQWYYNDNISYDKSHEKNWKHLGHFGYGHWFKRPFEEDYDYDSKYIDLFLPVFDKIQSFIQGKKILRARADMVTYQPKQVIYDQHTDFDIDNMSTILYMNETDGDTIFYKDNKEINRFTPVPNTLLIYSGNMMHTGCSPLKNNQRILLNSNYLVDHADI